jgi:hypothetical protein
MRAGGRGAIVESLLLGAEALVWNEPKPGATGCPIFGALFAPIAVLQLLYPETTIAEWLFP